MPFAVRVLAPLLALLLCSCGDRPAARPFELRRLAVVPAGVGAEVVAPVGTTGRRFLALASGERALRLFDAEDPAAPRLLWTTSLLGGEPTSVAARADLSEIYVTLKRDGARDAFGFVAVLRGGERGAPVVDRTYVVGVGPDCAALTPDENTLVVAVEDEDTPWRAGEVALIDVRAAATGAAIRRVDLEEFDAEPEYVAVAPEGDVAFVGLQEQSVIVAVCLRTARVIGRVHGAAGAEPDGIALSPSGRLLVAANEEAQTIDVFAVGPAPGEFRLASSVSLEKSMRRLADERGRPVRLLLPATHAAHDAPSKLRWDPEGAACLEYAGAPVAIIGLEKAGMLAAFSLRNPQAPQLVDVVASGAGPRSKPEVLARLRDGETIVAANEGEGTVALFRLAAPEGRPGKP